MEWPNWWRWELEITPHVEKRMEDRSFTEIDLRSMLDQAINYQPDILEGRWVINTKLQGIQWEVIEEPEPDEQRLVVITAYSVKKRR